jgi:O-antigen/teichoic acid export membrane protein
MSESRPLGLRVLAASSSNLLVLAARIVITLIVTPITFHALGQFDYGIWEITVSVSGYMALFDIGLRPSVARFATLHATQRSYTELRETLSTAWAFMLLLGTAAFVIFTCWGIFWLFHPPREVTHAWRYCVVMLIIGCQLAIVFPGQVAESALEGMQAYVAKNLVTLTLVIVGGIITITWIHSFDALLFVAAINTLGLAAKATTFFRMLRTKVPETRLFSLRWASMACYKRMATFGSKSFLQGAGEDIVTFAPPLVIGGILGPATVPLFRLPAAITDYARNVGWTAAYAFMTFFVELNTTGAIEKLRRAYLMGSRLTIASILPIGVVIIVLGDPFIGRWISMDLAHQARPLIPWVVAIYLSPLLSPMAVHYLTALGQHGRIAAVGTVLSILGVAAGTLAATRFGVLGFVECVAVAVMLKIPYRVWVASRTMGLPITTYVAEALWPAAPCALLQLGVTWMVSAHLGIDSWAELIGTGCVSATVYLIGFIALSREEDRAVLRRLVQHLRLRIAGARPRAT